MTDDLRALLSREALVEAAGEAAVDRGRRYASGGRVGEITERADGIAAVVQGQRRYRARLWVEGLRIRSECDCPVGESGASCKHAVALGLAWLDPEMVRSGPAGEPAQPGTGRRRIARTDGIAAYLAGLDGDSLRAVIETEAARNDEFRRRLALQATLSSPSADIKGPKAGDQPGNQPPRLPDLPPGPSLRPSDSRASRHAVEHG